MSEPATRSVPVRIPPPELEAVRAAHAARDWPGIRQVVDSLSSADDRMVVAGEICRSGDEEFYRSVVAATGEDPLALLLLGYTLLVTGWDIRGGGRAHTVGRERFAQFHDHLRRADAVLVQAAARQPERAEIWVARMTAAQGLELSQAETRRRFLQAVRSSPHMVSAQSTLLQKLLPKWGGDWEAAERFVRECVAQAPPVCANVVLVADLHLERGALEVSAEERSRYFADPRVRDDILQAARRGPLAPRFHPGLRAKSFYNSFACVLSLIEEHAAAALCFEVLGDNAGELPWGWLGDPVERFAFHRNRSFAMAIA